MSLIMPLYLSFKIGLGFFGVVLIYVMSLNGFRLFLKYKRQRAEGKGHTITQPSAPST